MPGSDCFGIGTLEWVESSGKGTVYAHTISYQPAHPSFKDDVPYVLAIIELEEGWRMNSNVVNIDPQDVTIGMPVEVVWDDVTPEISLPKFSARLFLTGRSDRSSTPNVRNAQEEPLIAAPPGHFPLDDG